MTQRKTKKVAKERDAYSGDVSQEVLKLYRDNPDPYPEMRGNFEKVRRDLEEIEKALLILKETPRFRSCR